MRKIFLIPVSNALLLFFIVTSFRPVSQLQLNGAWQVKRGTEEHVLIMQDGYFSYTIFDKAGKKFIHTSGGTFSESAGRYHVNMEFDEDSKDNVGSHKHFNVAMNGDKLSLDLGGGVTEWTRVDDGTANLAGNWRITGRFNNGQMQQIQKNPRKTLKILSSTRFQWMAINTETKEFFGTGGGTYTFKDGKYTENIEFFSRDSSRVGVSLTFDGSVKDNVWTHKGLNSRGEPLHEEWTREK